LDTLFLIIDIFFWAAEPGLPDYVIPVRSSTGGQAGFPFVVVSCRLVFVGGAWAFTTRPKRSEGGLRQPPPTNKNYSRHFTKLPLQSLPPGNSLQSLKPVSRNKKYRRTAVRLYPALKPETPIYTPFKLNP